MTDKIEPHLLYGQLQGWWIDREGRRFYLAARTGRQIIRKHRAWHLDLSVLKKAKETQADYVGVRVKTKAGVSIWLTPVDDFYDKTKSVFWQTPAGARALPIDQFLIRPDREVERIRKRLKVR